LPDNPFSTASQLLIDYLYEYYNIDSPQSLFFASNNFAVARKLFNQVGQFDLNFPLAAGEDREFCDRWLFHGYSLYYGLFTTCYAKLLVKHQNFVKKESPNTKIHYQGLQY
jgi:GT2 family glycosyltransferase